MYLVQDGFQASHINAMKYILNIQGDKQLYDPSNFALWRVAHHRLQTQQVLLREEPDSQQILSLTNLNLDMPDLHISADITRMSILIAAARKLLDATHGNSPAASPTQQQAEQLASTIQDLLSSIENWTSAVPGAWRSLGSDADDVLQPPEELDPTRFPIPQFPCPKKLDYHDPWLAYMWNFHAASQIILRESLVDILEYCIAMSSQQDLMPDHTQHILNEQLAVDQLSAGIIRSIPSLLHFTKQTQEPFSFPQGRMVGRLFSLFPIGVVQRARFTSDAHKKTASDVTQWLRSRHGL